MRSRLPQRPSPAMVVALLALFVSLGGSSYAALRIGTKQIKNNSVRSVDVRNNNLRSKDIRNRTIRTRDVGGRTLRGFNLRRDTLTGSEILESKLGTVPSAATAGTANRANSAAAVDRVRISGSSVTTAAIGETKFLAGKGPLSISLSCTDPNANGNPDAKITISTTQDNGAVDATGIAADADFDVADSPLTLVSFTDAAAASFAEGGTYTAIGADGTAISGQTYVGANKNGAKCVGGATALG